MASAQRQPAALNDLPVIELQEYEVIYNRPYLNPQFKFKSPQFSYFDIPTLPKGELILALDFIDRYRLADIPGTHKWAGLLTFPMIDGYERRSIKWLCMYMYDNVMYGYDPTPRVESHDLYLPDPRSGANWSMYYDINQEFNRRFVVPIRYEERKNPDVLYRFAQDYVSSVSPGRDQYIYIGGWAGSRMGGAFASDRLYVEVPEGRIEAIVDSQKDREPKDLVKLVYQFYQDPNPSRTASSSMGPSQDFLRYDYTFEVDFSWENIKKELGGFTVMDEIQLAKSLVAPRWSQIVTFHYKQDFLVWDLQNKSSILLFNIGNRLFAYSPRYGVWKTDGRAEQINNLAVLQTKLKYPGIKNVERIEFLPN